MTPDFCPGCGCWHDVTKCLPVHTVLPMSLIDPIMRVIIRHYMPPTTDEEVRYLSGVIEVVGAGMLDRMAGD